MRPILIAVVTALTLVILPPTASAATTPNFNFRHGEANYRTSAATVPGAYLGGERQPCPASGMPCTYEAHEFEIKPGEENGAFSVTITWGSADDDWDLYVYRVRADGSVDQNSPVASSAQGGTTEETATSPSSPDAPIEPGVYRIYVDNWAVATSQDWEGFVAFQPFVAANRRPTAVLTAPATAAHDQPVTLDGSGSNDTDGDKLVEYAWDLDGNGSFEVAGPEPTRTVTLPSGRRHVALRVKDERGGIDFARHAIDVALPPGPIRYEEIPPPAGAITIDVKARQKLRRFRIRGVAATITCPTSCEILGALRISRRTARQLKLGRKARNIAVRRRDLSGTRSTPRLALKPRKRVRNRIRRSKRPVSAVVRVTVSAEGYAPQTFLRRVTIVR